MDSPVSGLRALRAARLRTPKLPKPVIATLSPFFSALAITPSAGWKMALSALVASLRVTFSCSLSASIISARFMLVSRWLWTARKNSVVRKRRQCLPEQPTPGTTLLQWHYTIVAAYSDDFYIETQRGQA